MKINKGFTLVEALLSLVISCMIINGLVLALKQTKLMKDQYQISDLTALMHLEKLFLNYQEVKLHNEHEIRLSKPYLGNEDKTLIYKNNKLYVTPGVNILMNNISQLKLEDELNTILLTFKRGNLEKTYKFDK